MAKSNKPKQPKPADKKKKPAPVKPSQKKAKAKRPAKPVVPVVPAVGKTAETLPYRVENPLMKNTPEIKKIASDILESSGMSKFERIIHFFAKHDESVKNEEKGIKKADKENDEEIDPEALERGDIPMRFVDHLDEFRSRIIIIIIVFFILTIAGFVFSDELLYFINKPYTETGLKLNVFKLSEGFMMRLKVSAIAALIVGLPFIIFQIWRFMLPAVTKNDRWFGRLALIASILLFYSGVAFVYFLLMPFTVKMLLSFVAKDITSVIGASEYISFVFLFCFLMGALFEFPIVIMILTRIGLITPYFLSRNRKYAIVIIFIISAVITPTQDILTQSLVAVPLYLLYEASIIVSKMTAVRKKKKELEG